MSRPRKPLPPRWERWSARGDSNPDLHGLNVPRLPIAPRADDDGDSGPSGWTRTTTSRVKSPACCVHTTKGIGANGGIRTRTSRLGRPAGDRYPTFASGSAYGNQTRPSALATRDAFLHTQAERWTGVVHRPIAIRQFSKTPLWRACITRWRQRQDSNPDPRDLEARMLPLHHAAAAVFTVSTVFRDKTSP